MTTLVASPEDAWPEYVTGDRAALGLVLQASAAAGEPWMTGHRLAKAAGVPAPEDELFAMEADGLVELNDDGTWRWRPAGKSLQ